MRDGSSEQESAQSFDKLRHQLPYLSSYLMLDAFHYSLIISMGNVFLSKDDSSVGGRDLWTSLNQS